MILIVVLFLGCNMVHNSRFNYVHSSMTQVISKVLLLAVSLWISMNLGELGLLSARIDGKNLNKICLAEWNQIYFIVHAQIISLFILVKKSVIETFIAYNNRLKKDVWIIFHVQFYYIYSEYISLKCFVDSHRWMWHCYVMWKQ